MKQLHIGFISYPFPAFVNPTLPVVSAFVRRGYRVSYATTEAFIPGIKALGAEIICCPPILLGDHFGDEIEDKAGSVVSEFFEPMLDSVPTIAASYDEHRPNVIFHSNLALAGHILASRSGIPSVQFYSTFALDKENLFRQVNDAKLRRQLIEGSAGMDQLLQQHEVASRDFIFNKGKLSVFFVPKILQPLSDAFGSECVFAGRCAGEQCYRDSWQRRDTGDRPVVLVSASTMFNRGPEYFKMCIEALKGMPVQVILSIGATGRPEWYDPLPPHFEIVQGIPHPLILPYVDLLLFNSGTISTAEAIYHGVALLVTSHGFKELEWQGENIENLGIGIHIKKADMNAKSIGEFATQILSDSALLRRVRQFRDIVRRDPGAEEVANRIEEYMKL